MTTIQNYRFKGLSWKNVGLTVIFNTLIAVLLTFLFRDDTFWLYFIMSQCIGLCICTLCRTSLVFFNPQSIPTLAATLLAAIISGGLVGGLAGGWLAGIELANFLGSKVYAIRIVLLSLLFGGIIAFYFFAREKISETQQLLQQERIQRLTSEKHAVQSQLKMLQAQIEPHFLFNTLSNILSLLDTDVPMGKLMLRDLTRYLRASLAKTRSQWVTLGDEIELITAYLNLFKVRMGDRLRISIEVDDGLKSATFAPMLLQPLVENAILHGLDPMIKGGAIHIRAEQQNATLRVSVTDTGPGFVSSQSQGMGLANVRDRLIALYGRQGRLTITENQPTGVQAVIEVPYAADH
jgi:signal transduction histidine kinase